MANIFIADVSSYNGNVDWAGLKQRGVTGGIAKIIRKDLAKDNQFDNNYKSLHSNKMPWGVYNYSYATTAEKATSDMNLVCDILDKCDKSYFNYGVWFDIEDTVQASLSKAKIAEVINAAQKTVESRGYTFGVYTGMAYYKAHIDGSGVNCKNWWIARYYLGYASMSLNKAPDAGYKPTTPPDIVAWQYSSSVNTAGLTEGNGYKVDMSVLYKNPESPTKTVTTQTVTTKAVKIGSARIDENGNISGGAKGDQTGKEVAIEDYYDHSLGWVVMRPKSASVAKKIARAMRCACKNDNIGYSQSDRNSLYNVSQNIGFKTARVTTKCNCDCSSLVRVCLAYAGIKVADFNTASERQVIQKTGQFDLISSVNKNMLREGDILITKSKGHTAICLQGAQEAAASTKKDSGTSYAGTYPELPPRGFYQYGDGIQTYTEYPTQIKRVQMLMNWILNAKIAVDGRYGDETAGAVNKFKKMAGLKEDGCFNKSTLNAAKGYKK